MSNDATPPADAPGDGGDERDEAVAALLEVPPLDDVTRRRLVRTALDAADDEPIPAGAEPRRRSRLAIVLPVAAAIAIGIVVGSLVVTRPEDTPTAAPAPSTTVEAPAAKSGGASDGAAAETPAVVPVVSYLGDLGDVTETESLREAVGEARGAASGSPPPLPCDTTPAESLGLTAVDAIGTGLDTTQPVTVFVGFDSRGVETAVLVHQETCVPVARAEL